MTNEQFMSGLDSALKTQLYHRVPVEHLETSGDIEFGDMPGEMIDALRGAYGQTSWRAVGAQLALCKNLSPFFKDAYISAVRGQLNIATVFWFGQSAVADARWRLEFNAAWDIVRNLAPLLEAFRHSVPAAVTTAVNHVVDAYAQDNQLSDPISSAGLDLLKSMISAATVSAGPAGFMIGTCFAGVADDLEHSITHGGFYKRAWTLNALPSADAVLLDVPAGKTLSSSFSRGLDNGQLGRDVAAFAGWVQH
jgi:hypothetical protein